MKVVLIVLAFIGVVNSNDQTEVWKGCTIHAGKSIFEELSPFVNDVIEKATEDLEVNGCLDFAIGDVVKTGSTLCFCSTPECNGATGLHILGFLLVFSVVIQRFLA
ncbi:hypothetical protein TCAL_12718 [Tigriopus californicus]|uniref:Post-SET domain-containing protein n=1 Tax=Tigriopus californicus TaxID=6832 RepID=A0A553PTN6_TIGCA|nr:hypothetical protein TCAL_12718 [Tigriopus californicus]